MSLKSKAELMLTNNKLLDLGTEIEQLKRQINDKDIQLNMQREIKVRLGEEIKKKDLDIDERDRTIGDKE
jgi:hypothetical protein